MMLRLKFDFNSIIELVIHLRQDKNVLHIWKRQGGMAMFHRLMIKLPKFISAKTIYINVKTQGNFLMLEQALCLKTAIFHFKNGLQQILTKLFTKSVATNLLEGIV